MKKQTRTLADLTRRARQLDFTVKENWGEYRICPRGGREASAYYTEDIDDAWDTLHTMAADKQGRPRT